MHSFELSPNCSLTPRSAALFYIGVATPCLGAAGILAAAGLWPVLPFAGLEMIGLGIALYLSLRRGRIVELIHVDERHVIVAKEDGRTRTEHRFPRHWTRVELRQAGVATWPSRLVVGSMGRVVEIGAFLTEDERRSLRSRLDGLIMSKSP